MKKKQVICRCCKKMLSGTDVYMTYPKGVGGYRTLCLPCKRELNYDPFARKPTETEKRLAFLKKMAIKANGI